MQQYPVHMPIYRTLDRDKLVAWRKEVIAAREQWLAALAITRKTDFVWPRRRRAVAFCKAEAAECLKQERACTQIIEYIDGKRAGLGQLTGDKGGHLLYRVPPELVGAFRFCAGMA